MSDEKTSLESLKKEISKFCRVRNWDAPHNPKDLAIGAVTEASELLEIFRFMSLETSYELVKDKKKRGEISDELADILIFVCRFAELYDFDLSDCVRQKLEKNALRYPVK